VSNTTTFGFETCGQVLDHGLIDPALATVAATSLAASEEARLEEVMRVIRSRWGTVPLSLSLSLSLSVARPQPRPPSTPPPCLCVYHKSPSASTTQGRFDPTLRAGGWDRSRFPSFRSCRRARSAKQWEGRVRPKPYLHPTPYALHPSLYTPYTLHPTPYTINPKSQTINHKP